MAKNKRQGKGVFTSIGLPVSPAYQQLASRRVLWLYGTAAMLIIIAWLSYDFFAGSGTMISAGQLSSNHATMTKDCGRCHDSGSGVVSEKCSVCHEKTDQTVDVYSYASHYTYVSGDKSRIAGTSTEYGSREADCVNCHTEHNGQDATITETPDERCTTCHSFDSFESNHPEFDFIRNKLVDDSTLLFTHNRHTAFVLKEFETSGQSAILEDACLQCHISEPSGKGFLPLNFEQQCVGCHLKGLDNSVYLQVASETNIAGVDSWQTVRDKLGPIAEWTELISSADFVSRGKQRIAKKAISHSDPWIMHNLESLRRKLYANTELFDLIGISGSITKQQARPLLKDAISKLRAKATRLRGRPEDVVKSDVQRLDSLIGALDVLSYSLSSSQIVSLLDSDSLRARPELDATTSKQLSEMALSLTRGSNELCLKCHYLDKSAIMRVQEDQKSLKRSRFDHSVHILDRSCVDCHNVIPTEPATTESDSALILLVDNSKTFNLPGIDNCIKCHNPSAASASCITCHNFHPDMSQRSNLKLTARR